MCVGGGGGEGMCGGVLTAGPCLPGGPWGPAFPVSPCNGYTIHPNHIPTVHTNILRVHPNHIPTVYTAQVANKRLTVNKEPIVLFCVPF